MVEQGGYQGEPPQEHEHQEQREQDQTPYYKAARFGGEQIAGRVYFQAQDLIFDAIESELSAYRLMFNAIYHVAVLGEQPSAKTDQALTRILAQGKIVSLPSEVLGALNTRRLEMKSQGEWVEGHYRPGIRLDEEQNAK
jgi:hypothetical protein